MAHIKYTKIEWAKLVKKRLLLEKYLPTLELKKSLLQVEVQKAEAEIVSAQKKWEKELSIVKKHAALLTDPASELIDERVMIEKVHVETENIAGINVPFLNQITFVPFQSDLLSEPVWLPDLVGMIRTLKKANEKVKIAKRKKQILEKELRTVSIRVNLFEKRMIPETTRSINQIKIFLSDQELQAVGSAKVSKNKVLQKKRR